MKQIPIAAFKHIIQTSNQDPSVDFINVCTPAEYAEQHIRGVRSVPLDELERRVHEFDDKKTIYVHCRSGRRGAAAIQKLAELGVNAQLINVEGGLNAWEEAGFETERGSKRIPLMRQVFLTAGLAIATGSVLALTIDARFAYIPLVLSAGLIISGGTGWCGLALLLARMPWNR